MPELVQTTRGFRGALARHTRSAALSALTRSCRLRLSDAARAGPAIAVPGEGLALWQVGPWPKAVAHQWLCLDAGPGGSKCHCRTFWDPVGPPPIPTVDEPDLGKSFQL